MKEKHTMETVREIRNNEDGIRYEVGPDRDVGGWPEIRLYEKDEHDCRIRFAVPPDAAHFLAKALIECANELAEK
jgi:hypothetical protein